MVNVRNYFPFDWNTLCHFEIVFKNYYQLITQIKYKKLYIITTNVFTSLSWGYHIVVFIIIIASIVVRGYFFFRVFLSYIIKFYCEIDSVYHFNVQQRTLSSLKFNFGMSGCSRKLFQRTSCYILYNFYELDQEHFYKLLK